MLKHTYTLIFALYTLLAIKAHANGECFSLLSGEAQTRLSTSLVPAGSSKLGLLDLNSPAVSESSLVKLIDAQIIHSEFFVEILEVANKRPWKEEVEFGFDSPEKIALHTKEQTDQLANLIFRVMQATFDNHGDAIASLDDPRLSRSVFRSSESSEVIDKIGESLIVVGSERQHLDVRGAIASRQKVSDEEGIAATVGGVWTLLNGGIWALEYTSSFRPSNLLFDSTVWQVSATAGLALFTIPIFKAIKRVSSAPAHVLENRVSAHDTIEGQYRVEPDLKYISGDSLKSLQELSERSEELSHESDEPTHRNILTFGAKSVQLHRELNTAFHSDFVRWMSIYQTNRDRVKDRIRELRSGNLQTSEAKRDIFNFLAKMLTEASEATVLTSELSFKILSAIGEDLEKLRAMEIGEDNSFVRRDRDRRVDFLSLAQVTYGQFVQSLEPVHVTISNLLQSIETLGLAESAAITADLGNVSQSVNQSETIDSILEGLNEMDVYLERLQSEGTSFIDGEVIN